MQRMSVKRTQFVRHCIFCDAPRVSREHVYADWMRDYLPVLARTVHEVSLRGFNPASGEFGKESYRLPGVMNKTGAPRSRKLYIACEPCNNGWMSVLQESARPFLQPLVQQGTWRHLTVAAQTAIASWACMFTMVYERAHPETAAINAAQHRRFMETKVPGDEWRMWVGRPDEHFTAGNFALHRGRGAAITSDSRTMEVLTQVTIAAPGKFAFMTSCDRRPGHELHPMLSFMLDQEADRVGFVRIWPTQERPIFSDPVPARLISNSAALQLVDSIARIWG